MILACCRDFHLDLMCGGVNIFIFGVSLFNQLGRLARQGEWMPKKIFIPTQHISSGADVLPGIYSIGLSGDMFSVT